jgi:paraquat-inducible protein B
VRAQIDLRTFQFAVPVTIHLDPQRLGVKVLGTASGSDLEHLRRRLIDSLVAHGVRAQLRTGKLLTGAVYVALDFFPGAPPVTLDWAQRPVQLPTVPGQLEQTEACINNIIKKLNQLPLQQIGDNLQKALGDLDLTLVSARGTLTAAQGTLGNTSNLTASNSAQVQQLDGTLQEVSRAARSVRVLADYLERHPETLIRGKQGAPK